MERELETGMWDYSSPTLLASSLGLPGLFLRQVFVCQVGMLGWYALWHRLEPHGLFVAAQANQNHHPTHQHHQHGSMKAHLKEAHAATEATELLEIVRRCS